VFSRIPRAPPMFFTPFGIYTTSGQDTMEFPANYKNIKTALHRRGILGVVPRPLTPQPAWARLPP